MHKSRNLRTRLSLVTTAALLAGTLVVSNAAVVSAAGPSCPITVHESGSTTVYPALVQATPGFQAANGGCTLSLIGSGSGAGLTDLLNGVTEVAASSRPLKTGTEQSNLYSWKVGADAMVIAVKASANMSFVGNITKAQVKGIYEGSITNWSSLGGPNVAIVPRSRTTVSGTYSDLLSLFGISGSLEAATITATGLSRLNTSQDEATAACNNDYQIVYTSLANVQLYGPGGSGCLKALTLETVAPSVLTVQNQTYPAPRELFLAMRKSSFTGFASDSGITKGMDLVNYMLSSAGQAAVGAVGFVQVAIPTGKKIVDYDINTDGAVGLADIGQITGKWGQTSACPGWVRADVNNDGAIGLADIGQITGRWGSAGFAP